MPIATPAEVIGTLTIVSFDPGRPITRRHARHGALDRRAGGARDRQRAAVPAAEGVRGHDARSLLPRSHPELQGLEIGEVYEPSARVDVGGDVYDFLELGGGRLAVVLGDVTGHGIEAAADMAMAKFVFRSLAREHSEPGDFLALGERRRRRRDRGGQVHHDDLPRDRCADAARSSCACAGHPAPLLVAPDGTVEQFDVSGLALGVEPGQTYEEATATVERGGALVVYTDGVIEARRDGEFYGVERLVEVVGASLRAAGGARSRARSIEDCREFAGDLADDCALVVIKR